MTAPTTHPAVLDGRRKQAAEQLRILAARTDPKDPGTPPWAWVNLTADQAECLDSALDEFVDTYNRIHAGTVEDVIPACWRLHPPLAQEMPVAYWAWWAAHADPKSTVVTALEYYSRHLPGFQTRLRERLLGKGAVSCRKGSHTRPAADVAYAASFDPTLPTEATGKAETTRKALRNIDFGVLWGRSGRGTTAGPR